MTLRECATCGGGMDLWYGHLARGSTAWKAVPQKASNTPCCTISQSDIVAVTACHRSEEVQGENGSSASSAGGLSRGRLRRHEHVLDRRSDRAGPGSGAIPRLGDREGGPLRVVLPACSAGDAVAGADLQAGRTGQRTARRGRARHRALHPGLFRPPRRREEHNVLCPVDEERQCADIH